MLVSGKIKRFWLLMGFIFCCRSKDDLSKNIDKVALEEWDYRKKKFEIRLLYIELLFVKIFCPEETLLKFRRRYCKKIRLLETDMTLHKDLVCGLLVSSVTFIVKFFNNYQYFQKFMSQEDCKKHGYITTNVGDKDCWCTVNLVGHIPTFLIVVFAGCFAVAAVMRVIVTFIFNVWLEPTYKKSTWAMSTLGCNWEDEITLPQKADVTFAIYGFPKNSDSKDSKEWIENLRDVNYSTLPEIMDFFDEHRFWVVTEIVQYYLTQGTTTFWLKPLESSEKPIMIVKGEWNGGGCRPRSKIRRMISCDAIQAICISLNDGVLKDVGQDLDEKNGDAESPCTNSVREGPKEEFDFLNARFKSGGCELKDLHWEQTAKYSKPKSRKSRLFTNERMTIAWEF